MEGGIHPGEADASAFRECFSLTWKNPYVLRLAFSAGIGGLLFGYDTGSIPLSWHLLHPLRQIPVPFTTPAHIIKAVMLTLFSSVCDGREQGLYQELSCTLEMTSSLLIERPFCRYYLIAVIRSNLTSLCSFFFFLLSLRVRGYSMTGLDCAGDHSEHGSCWSNHWSCCRWVGER